jgi:lipoyl(octanoyl) transferase
MILSGRSGTKVAVINALFPFASSAPLVVFYFWMELTIIQPGRVPYGKALEMQYDLLAKRQEDKIKDTLILLEHDPVITMGKRGNHDDILAEKEYLKEIGTEIFEIERGGEVTYHGPGQIVGYLIINLYNHQRKIRSFVEKLEGIFIELLENTYGIKAGRDSEHTGVWVGNEKITAIGIAIKKGVTMHGFAFNINTDLSHYNWIVPCGIHDRGVTSLQKLTGRVQPIEKVQEQIVTFFCRTFGYEVPEIDTKPAGDTQ